MRTSGWTREIVFKTAHGLSDYIIPRLERPEAWDGRGIRKVPLIFRDAYEIANGRVGAPSAAQGGLGQFRRNSCAQEIPDIGIRRNRLDWREAGNVERFFGLSRVWA
jgi:hypothetical protein